MCVWSILLLATFFSICFKKNGEMIPWFCYSIIYIAKVKMAWLESF